MAKAIPVNEANPADAVVQTPVAEQTQPIAEKVVAPALTRAAPKAVSTEAIEGLHAEAIAEGKSAQLFERFVRVDN